MFARDKLSTLLCVSAIALHLTKILPNLAGADLEEVASFPNQQVTGVAVSKTGCILVNFPNWSDDHTISVAEIKDGNPVPFPNEEWNKAGPAESHFICVQSVYVDDQDDVWILDPAAPKMQEVVKGGPKLLRVDLKRNEVVQTIRFDEEVAPKNSYVNDVRVDRKAGYAFITDSNIGAIIVVDLNTGKARRLLDGHKSVKDESDVKLNVDGRELLDEQKRKTPQINSDGIALDLQNDWLYYHALTGHTLYRIKTQYLKDANLSKSDLESKVEEVAKTPAPDGMLEGKDGSVYLTAIEENAIVRFDPATKSLTRVIQDKRLSWPDSMSWGPEESLYVTASQIQNMPRFNGGQSARTEPYKVYRLRFQ